MERSGTCVHVFMWSDGTRLLNKTILQTFVISLSDLEVYNALLLMTVPMLGNGAAEPTPPVEQYKTVPADHSLATSRS
jgi:hypothetical protein